MSVPVGPLFPMSHFIERSHGDLRMQIWETLKRRGNAQVQTSLEQSRAYDVTQLGHTVMQRL